MKYLFVTILLTMWLVISLLIMVSVIGAILLMASGQEGKWFSIPKELINTFNN